MNVVDQIMIGTGKLNLMRTEIKSVVSTLISTLEEFMVDEEKRGSAKMDPGVIWVLRRYQILKDGESLTHVQAACYNTKTRYLLFVRGTSGSNNKDSEVENVRMIHESLCAFAEWVFAEFPGAKEKLKPILETAVS